MTIFQYLKLLKQKVKEEEVCNFNPIFGEDKQKFSIKEYCKVNKININNLSGCECFVCYEKLSDCKRLCLPYKCNHIICYHCFCKHCHLGLNQYDLLIFLLILFWFWIFQ